MRSTRPEKRLNALVLLAIENKLLNTIDLDIMINNLSSQKVGKNV